MFISIVKVIEYMRALPFNAGKCRAYLRHVDRGVCWAFLARSRVYNSLLELGL